MNLGLSILPSGSFLRTGTLVFPETQYGFRGSCGVVCERAGFLGKKIYAKIGENGPKIGFLEFIGDFSC